MTTKEIVKLQSLLSKMKPGPYEYWATDSNDMIAAECKDGKGNLIAALPGITSLPKEFTAITALLNAAPELIKLALLAKLAESESGQNAKDVAVGRERHAAEAGNSTPT
jgi:hypothetical protein